MEKEGHGLRTVKTIFGLPANAQKLFPATDSALRLPPEYSFSLLCRVFRLMPSTSAARVLLLWVDCSVFMMSWRSASPTVVPTSRRTSFELPPAAACAGIADPKLGGRCRGSTSGPLHTITARSNVLRISRTLPGHEYSWKRCI